MFSAFQEALDTALSGSMKISCSFLFLLFLKLFALLLYSFLKTMEAFHAIRLSLADNAVEIAEY